MANTILHLALSGTAWRALPKVFTAGLDGARRFPHLEQGCHLAQDHILVMA